jgi:hypothetical protein
VSTRILHKRHGTFETFCHLLCVSPRGDWIGRVTNEKQWVACLRFEGTREAVDRKRTVMDAVHSNHAP